MPDDPSLPEAVLWTDEAGAALMGDVLSRLESAVRLRAVGGPRAGELARFSRDRDLEPQDDLRRMLVQTPTPFVVIAAREGFGLEDLAIALEQEAVVLSLEPIFDRFDQIDAWLQMVRRRAELRRHGSTEWGPLGRVRITPAFTDSPGWLRAAEPGQAGGKIEAVSFWSVGPQAQRSLFTRLVEAWRTLLRYTPMPLAVDATLCGAEPPSPAAPRRVQGHLLVHARMPDNAAATLFLSDQAGAVGRELQVIARSGHWRVRDLDYELFDREGKPIDGGVTDSPRPTLEELIAREWLRFADRPPHPRPSWPDEAEILACCQACLLSARTGENEQPSQILTMEGRR
jgi:hypothetical protein